MEVGTILSAVLVLLIVPASLFYTPSGVNSKLRHYPTIGRDMNFVNGLWYVILILALITIIVLILQAGEISVLTYVLTGVLIVSSISWFLLRNWTVSKKYKDLTRPATEQEQTELAQQIEAAELPTPMPPYDVPMEMDVM